MDTELEIQKIAERHSVNLDFVQDEYLEYLGKASDITEALWATEIVVALSVEDALHDFDVMQDGEYTAMLNGIMRNANEIYGEHAVVV